MKNIVTKAAIAACSLTLFATVHAQSSVNIYGLVDAALDYNTNADAAGHSRVWMPSLGGGMFPSRLGFKGSEDLGGGLKAIFTLENGFYVDSGSLGQNRLFGRQAWVGLAGDWGQVTVGRNYNMIYNSFFEVDILGPSQYGLGAIDPAIPNGRSDNSIAYKGTFDKVTIGATYSLGRDVSNAGGPSGANCAGESSTDVQACREWSAMARYDSAGGGLVAGYDRVNGGTGAAAGLTRSDLTDSRLHLAGYVRYGAWKFAAGAMRRKNEGSLLTPTSTLSYVGAAYKATPALTFDGHLARLDYRDSGNDTNEILLRAMLDLSKRTTVYIATGRMDNHGTAAIALSAGGMVGVGKTQNGVISGLKHSF